MPTTCPMEAELKAWVVAADLFIELVSSDPFDDNAEFRIHTRRDGIRPMPREILFQGTQNRCADFMRGYLQGKAASK